MPSTSSSLSAVAAASVSYDTVSLGNVDLELTPAHHRPYTKTQIAMLVVCLELTVETIHMWKINGKRIVNKNKGKLLHLKAYPASFAICDAHVPRCLPP